MTAEEAESFWEEFDAQEEWTQLPFAESGAVYDLDAGLFGMDADLSWQEALAALNEIL